MINYADKALFSQDSISKAITITGDGFQLTNSDLDADGLELMESLCSQSTIKIGSCESSSIKFKTKNLSVDLLNQTITVSILPTGASDPLQIGVFKVTSDIISDDGKTRSITAYDALYEALKQNVASWYRDIFPSADDGVTIKDFRDSLFEYLGIEQEQTTLINDSFVVYRTIVNPDLSGKDVMQCICEINASFGHIGRDGKFHYIILSNNATTIDSNGGYKSISEEDYVTAPITGLRIRQEEDDVGVFVGSVGNTYIIEGNFLVYGFSTSQITPLANNILDEISNISYKPCEIEMAGNPCIEVGDKIKISRASGDLDTYVLQRKMTGIQILNDTLIANGAQNLPNKSNSINSQIIQLKGKSAVLSATIEGVSSRVTEIEEDYTTYTEFSQTADSLTLAISDLQNEIDGSIEIIYTDEAPTLANYPAWDWTDMRAFDSDEAAAAAGDVAWTASDDLHFLYNDDGYDPHRRTMVYDQTNSVTYRFVKTQGQWVWQVLENTEFSVVLEKISALELTTDSIEASVSSLTADLEDNYYTISETSSLLSQTSTSIMASVSGTYATKSTTNELSASLELKLNKDDLVSELNASADVITLTSNRISITSDYFTLTADGRITATGGTIGGFTLDSNSIRYEALTSTSSGAIGLSSSNFTRTIGGTSRSNLRFAIGSNFAVSSAGALYANSGIIGGFTLTSNKLHSGSDGNNAGMGGGGTYAFWAGNETPGSAPFRVGHSGNLTATNANISGTIKSTAGSIGGFTITSSSIYNGVTSITDMSHEGIYIGTSGINVGKGAFQVTKSGSVAVRPLKTDGTGMTFYNYNSTTPAAKFMATPNAFYIIVDSKYGGTEWFWFNFEGDSGCTHDDISLEDI